MINCLLSSMYSLTRVHDIVRSHLKDCLTSLEFRHCERNDRGMMMHAPQAPKNAACPSGLDIDAVNRSRHNR